MKIYLAGENKRDLTRTHWRYRLTIGACERVVAGQWDPKKKAILGAYHYAGPFIPVERIEDPNIPGHRFGEHELRCAAIRSSDLVFTWLPSMMALYELGIAYGAGIKTAVAGPPGFWEAGGVGLMHVDYELRCDAAPTALVEAVKRVQASGHFFNGVWRRMVGKFGSECIVCGDQTEIGDDIMWRKKSEEAKGGEVCHPECFVLNAPAKVMDKDLQAVGMELLRKRVRRLEEENSRLHETIQDLA
jgi:hypothetical protein